MTLRMWTAILAGLQVGGAGTVLADLFDPQWVALFSLFVAAAQAGTAVYMRGTPPATEAGKTR